MPLVVGFLVAGVVLHYWLFRDTRKIGPQESLTYVAVSVLAGGAVAIALVYLALS